MTCSVAGVFRAKRVRKKIASITYQYTTVDSHVERVELSNYFRCFYVRCWPSGLLQLEEVKWAALHADETLRMSALSLLCADLRVTTVPAQAETRLIQEVIDGIGWIFWLVGVGAGSHWMTEIKGHTTRGNIAYVLR